MNNTFIIIRCNVLFFLILFLLIIFCDIRIFANEIDYRDSTIVILCENDKEKLSTDNKGIIIHQQIPFLFQPDDSIWKSEIVAANNAPSSECAIGEKDKDRDWNKYSFFATLIGTIFTILSIIVVYLIFRSENKDTKQQLSLLQNQVNNSNQQIKNQKTAQQKTSQNSLMVLYEMKKSVLEVKDHMVNKDVYLKLIEHKQTIKSSFSFLLKNYFIPQGAKVADGTIMQDRLVNDKVSDILDRINIIDGIIEEKTDIYSTRKLLCEKDLNNLFGKRPNIDDNVAAWIKEMKMHFAYFDKVLEEMVINIKNQKTFDEL